MEYNRDEYDRSMFDRFTIHWHDRGRPPKVAPNPDYPDGIELDLRQDKDRSACNINLPYPTGHENIGTWVVECSKCGLRIGITAASRPDDPRSALVNCKTVA